MLISLLNIIDRYFLEPIRWMSVYHELETLRPHIWLGASVIDYWIHLLQEETGRYDIPYIDYGYLHGGDLNDEQIQHFRRSYNLPLDGQCPQTPVIGFHHVSVYFQEVHNRNHYCCFYLDIARRELHLLGYNHHTSRSTSRSLVDDQTSTFHEVCQRIFQLHGWEWEWDLAAHPITIYETNWRQNGFDCGPMVCQIIEHIWINGFNYRGRYWNRPELACGHQMRYRMATDIHQKIQQNITSFNNLPAVLTPGQLDVLFQQGWDDSREMVQDIIQDIQTRPNQNFGNIHQSLLDDMQQCPDCIRSDNNYPSPIPHQSSAHSPILNAHSPILNAHAPILDSQLLAHASTSPAKEQSDDDSSDPALINKDIHVRDFSQAQISRFHRPTPPPTLPPLVPGQQLRLRDDNPIRPFDDYQDRPPRENLQPIPYLALHWAGADAVYIAGKLAESPWLTHRDYGYRLEPDFAQAFHLPPPIMVMDHLMPVGLESTEPRNLDELLAFFETRTQSSNSRTMGALEMIQYANHTRNDNIFITGRTEDGDYVRVDLERDIVSPRSIVISADIDSVIWVTRFPQFAKWINIYMQPVIRKQAPISKHNHVYIDVRYPPSERDPDADEEHVRFKLNQIPHIFLGKVGEGGGTANLYMFFPRMTHKHPYIRRYSNMVPWDLQGILWDRVIIPAMKRVATPADEPYIGFDREDLAFKAQEKGEKRPEATYPLKPQQLVRFFEHINTIVSVTCSY